MQRKPRFIRPGLYEITVRTIQGRLLLRPSAATNDAILGVLGRAQDRFAMTIHAAVFLSNHFHMLVSPRDARHLADFMCFLNSNVAREVGRLVEWETKFWSRRYQAIPVSDEPEAQLERLRYILSQGVKEGLVAHPFDWPGVNTARALAEGEPLVGTWFDRSGLWNAQQRRKKKDPPPKANDFKTVYRLALTQLPCLAHLSTEEQRLFIRGQIGELVAITAAHRTKPVMGCKQICRQHPHSIPSVSSSPAPLIHAASRATRRSYREAYSLFLVAYREAAANLKHKLPAFFPAGCFPPALPFVELAA